MQDQDAPCQQTAYPGVEFMRGKGETCFDHQKIVDSSAMTTGGMTIGNLCFEYFESGSVLSMTTGENDVTLLSLTRKEGETLL